MFKPTKWLGVLGTLIVLSMVLVSMNVGVAVAQGGEEPVTLYAYSTTEIPTLDPQMAEDVVSINYIENLFLGLTDYHPETANIRAEMATEWEISEDGLTYTFYLRDDVNWVRYDPETGETEVIRPVVAQDFVDGIRRGCDPNLGSYYSSIIAPVIEGCGDVYNMDPEEVTPEVLETVGVEAPDDTTVIIHLAFPASYFMSMTPMWTLRAVPLEVIEEYGEEWTEPGNIVTNGAYMLAEWTRGVRRVVIRNPYFPEDMLGPGNVERVVADMVEDLGTGFALYLDGMVESTGIPGPELQSFLEERPEEVIQISDLAVFYTAFAYDKPPFDDVHVRRAFSAAIDRESFIQEVNQGRGLPMRHFAPPGIFGAPPIDEVGVGYDPEWAQEQLAEAGYPNCEGFPTVTIVAYASAQAWVEFLQTEWERVLGCPPELINIELQEFAVLLESTSANTPTEERPHMWTLGWGPDYPDENNWVGDVLWCEVATRQKRECNEIDDLIVQARESTDPQERIELYRQIEDAFFGYEGEFPFAPIYLRVTYVAHQPWYTGPFETDGLFGGVHYDWYTIDVEQQPDHEE